MKKFFILILFICTVVAKPSFAEDNRPMQLSPAEFRTKQMEFFKRDAALTDDEAAKFFPIYYELQDKKKVINDKTWQFIRQAKNGNLSESEYKMVLENIYDSRLMVDKLEKAYLYRFKRILSYKKILLLHRAEMRFGRLMIRDMGRHGRMH